MSASPQFMGLSAPSTGEAGGASPLRDSLRSPKSDSGSIAYPLSLATLGCRWLKRPSTGISPASLPPQRLAAPA